ncbi:hypothetical protein [Duncaniella muris]|jgi:hypothetical protein|uniref:hypothetical protein n=1 Tax=Duncaniella muris TaxID=2094150 RepID=UPI0025B75DAD|nr:hypothetical protein [Duncaniella muris]
MRNLFGNTTPEPTTAAPQNEGGREIIDDPNKDEPTKAHTLRPKQIKRRAVAEIELENLLPWHFNRGDAYHVFSYGKIDSIAYLRAILKQQPLEYLACQTFYLSTSHIEQIQKWLTSGLIKRLDFYVGEVFKYKYIDIYLALKNIITPSGGRVGILRNHAKIMVGFGDRFDFVAEGSANFNVNPRSEQMCITIDEGLARFYKEDIFDNMKPLNIDEYNWQPYKLKRDEII